MARPARRQHQQGDGRRPLAGRRAEAAVGGRQRRRRAIPAPSRRTARSTCSRSTAARKSSPASTPRPGNVALEAGATRRPQQAAVRRARARRRRSRATASTRSARSGDLVCRELADGKEVWRTNVLKETDGQAAAVGLRVEPADRRRPHLRPDRRGRADRRRGQQERRQDRVEVRGPQQGRLRVARLRGRRSGKPQLIIFAGKAVGGIDPETGKTIWDDKFETQYDVNAATPIFHDGRVLFTAEYDTGRAAMYELDGERCEEGLGEQEPQEQVPAGRSSTTGSSTATAAATSSA